MNKYIKIAEQLESNSNNNLPSLDKLAAVCLLYEYLENDNFNIENSPSLAKMANRVIDEKNIGLIAGIELAIDSFKRQES